ncbi:hypothetical protein [Anaerocolumna jejuensis]|uniref:hypothetical protein n=1 Tax=Anaerocolumna jejuensis TaxID=259063 RepID=UPI003F7C299B
MTDVDVKNQMIEFYKSNICNPNARIQLSIVDNIYERCLEVVVDDLTKRLIIKNKDTYENGTVVPGKCLDDIINVVISNKVFEYDEFTWKGTIHHELTHAYDYYDFANYLEVEYMSEIYKNKYYNCFISWSEFHARRVGFMHIWNSFYNESNYNEGKENAQISFQQHILYLNKNINTSNALYEFMQFCGRYSVFNDLYPNEFSDFDKAASMISVNIEEKSLLSDFYKFLYNNCEFTKIKDNLRNLFGHFRKFLYR